VGQCCPSLHAGGCSWHGSGQGGVINVCNMLRWYSPSVAFVVPGNMSPHDKERGPSNALSPCYSRRWKVPQLSARALVGGWLLGHSSAVFAMKEVYAYLVHTIALPNP